MTRQAPTPEELKQARMALKKSQVTVAALLGVTHATYSRWEKGHCIPAPDRREKLWRLVQLGQKVAKGGTP